MRMGRHTERPVKAVPKMVLSVLATALALQLWFACQRPGLSAGVGPLPPVPAVMLVAPAAFGEPATLSRLLMLWLQAFDNPPGASIPFRDLDYARLTDWLRLIMALDTHSTYPLLSASRLYTAVPDDHKRRLMLDFVDEQFLLDPDRHWSWMAHAVYVAKHRLQDNTLALRYAEALRLNVTDPTVPAWVTQMEIFVYEDIGDRESAQIITGGLLASGRVAPGSNEERFLLNKLQELQGRAE